VMKLYFFTVTELS
jgi:hypothetical protein